MFVRIATATGNHEYYSTRANDQREIYEPIRSAMHSFSSHIVTRERRAFRQCLGPRLSRAEFLVQTRLGGARHLLPSVHIIHDYRPYLHLR
jgi:hypothetical protein